MSTLERHSLMIPDALDTLRSRCDEMKECQALCRRVYERLRAIADELRGIQNERVLHSSDVPTQYSGLIKYFLYVLDTQHEKATLSRLTSSRTLTQQLRELHDGIDLVVKLLSLEHNEPASTWKEDWEQDLMTQWGLLQHAVKNTELIRSELVGRELIEALTEIKFETEYRGDSYAPEHIELLTQTFMAVARTSKEAAAAYKTPKWFIPRYELMISRENSMKSSTDPVHRCTWGKVTDLVVKNFGVESVGKRQLFAKEIERWSCFDHPNVIRLYGANHASTPGLLVMEDASNGNFVEYFRGSENKQRFWQLFYQAALGLQYLLRERRAHGNLKCSNLLVGKDGVAKVSDFCFSSLTNRWKALERIQGFETPTAKSDVYSLGMCIIEAVTGEPPWYGEDDNSILNSLLDGSSHPCPDGVFSGKQWALINDLIKIKAKERLDLDAAIVRLKELVDEEEREVLLWKRTSEVRVCSNCQFSVTGDQDLCDQCGSPLPADPVRRLRVLVRNNKNLNVEEKLSLVDDHIFKLGIALKKEVVTRQLWDEHAPKVSLCDECGEASSFDSNFCCDCGASLGNLWSDERGWYKVEIKKPVDVKKALTRLEEIAENNVDQLNQSRAPPEPELTSSAILRNEIGRVTQLLEQYNSYEAATAKPQQQVGLLCSECGCVNDREDVFCGDCGNDIEITKRNKLEQNRTQTGHEQIVLARAEVCGAQGPPYVGKAIDRRAFGKRLAAECLANDGLEPPAPAHSFLLPSSQMRSRASKPPSTPEEKHRVLDAFTKRGDWQTVAKHNGLARATAWHVVLTGRVESLSCGGACQASTKRTPAIEKALIEYIDDNCGRTLTQMEEMVWFNFCVNLSTSIISRKLLNHLYIVKQENAREGDRATLVLPPSKGANLQVQCAVSVSDGVVLHRLERGSIKIEQNAAFVEDVYQSVKSSSGFNQHYQGKKVVIVLDNAPAHHQTEKRVPEHDDAVILRLGPYLPMCNSIEGCFSVLKASIKASLRHRIDEMNAPRCNITTMTEQRMQIFENAVVHAMKSITPHVVRVQYGHAVRAVEAARQHRLPRAPKRSARVRFACGFVRFG